MRHGERSDRVHANASEAGYRANDLGWNRTLDELARYVLGPTWLSRVTSASARSFSRLP
jgi:hypothetical protein